MKPHDKFKLIQALNLTNVMTGLDYSDDIEFVEQVAKLTNVLGVELCKIWEEMGPETKSTVYIQIELLFQFLLKFLADEYDDTSCAVFSFLSAFLSVLKKQIKQVGELSSSQREFLDSLLKVIVIKMKFDDESETDDDGEGEAEFSVMRKNLKSFFDIIYNIDSQLFTTYVHFAVLNTLANYEKAGNSFDWRDLELALHVLLLYGEAIKGQLQFMKTENEIVKLTPLGEMLQKMVQCNVTTYSHPLIILNFFENVVRYYQFFEVQPEYIPSVLEVFVDSRGLHSHDSQIRSRSWYLFYRFIKLLKSNVDKYVETDLLIIQAVVPRVDNPDESPLTKDKALEAGFSEQLYILETVELQSYLNTKLSEPVDVHTVLQLHHLIMAIGSIAKGFPEAPKRSAPIAPWVDILKQATEAILVTLKALDCYEIIRDASRYSFARLVNVLGIEILPYLPTLINGLLSKCEASELVDVLPFIGLISHKFNPSIFDILNELIVPLVNKVFVFFNQPPSGTDDVLLLVNLRKAYLNFILSLLNGGMDAVFIMNRPRLESILQSVIHYASDLSDIPTARLSFNILSKTLTLWGEQLQSSGLYEHILRICFEVPMKPSFNANDGQSQLVLNEISNILKIILSQKGDDFVKYLGTFLTLWSPPYDLDNFLQTLQQPDIKMFRNDSFKDQNHESNL
ncbi:11500_t:CDS:10 [Diversispora eburnea]|uniref:Exportin-T n=1 Tax=Diversispora eburnea TaxID=1213867 RepID=A0A9N8V2G2_9GLOM|nr:11500_t:CDS:10 [Diversispora eburnea]